PQKVLPNENWMVSVSSPGFLRIGLARLITMGPTGARQRNDRPTEARSWSGAQARYLRQVSRAQSLLMNTLPTSRNADRRVLSLFSLTNGVGKMTSAVATTLSAPPSGR